MGRFRFPTAYNWGPCGTPSTNSYEIVTLTTAAAYDARDGARLVADFNGKHWLLGGWDPVSHPWHVSDITTNEVWSTPAAGPDSCIVWTKELAHDDNPPTVGAGARWRRRHTFPAFKFDGYIWVIGGDGSDSAFTLVPSDVWRSPDGVTWERVAASCPWGYLYLPQCAALGDWMYLFGGFDATNYASKRVWRSQNGADWERQPDAPIGRAGIYDMPEMCGRLYVIGGDSLDATPRTRHSSTWAFNGVGWRQMSAVGAFTPVDWNAVCVWDNALWTMNGAAPGNTKAVWYSRDAGVTWTELYPTAPWNPTHADGLMVVSDGIVLASGNDLAKSVYKIQVAP